jgi:putative membrane protein
MKPLLAFTVVMSWWMVCPGAASGQGVPDAPTGLVVRLQGVDAGQVQGDPVAFVMKASEASVNVIEAARLAAGGKASTAGVRALAARLLSDHGRARVELIELAGKVGARPDGASAMLVTTALNRVSGAAFDRAFVTQVTLDLGVALALCEEQSRSGSNAETRAWATRSLPMVREHLRLARSLGGDATGAPKR